MPDLSLSDISKKMAAIDIAMLSTRTEGGAIAARPMSNNGDVEYRGSSYYFTFEASRTVADIARDSKVSLGFQGEGHLYIAIEGDAETIRDKAAFKEHWTPDLDRWFENGADTDGVVMLKITASRVHYWDGEDAGEVAL